MSRRDLTGWTIPTKQELIDRITADYDAAVAAVSGYASRPVLAVLKAVKAPVVKTYAGASWILHEMAAYLVRQIFIQYSDDEYLDDHGLDHLIPRKDATFSKRTILFTGTASTVVPFGTTVFYSDGTDGSQLVFKTDAAGTITGGPAQAYIVATCQTAGVAGNLPDGAVVSMAFAVSGVDTLATVTATGLDVDAIDEESDDDYRARILDYLSTIPSPASPTDLREIALSVSGIDRCWAQRSTPYPGTCRLVITSTAAGEANNYLPDDDGGAYHVGQALGYGSGYFRVYKADLDAAVGRTTVVGDFAGGLLVLRPRDPLTREWLPISSVGLSTYSATIWNIPVDTTPSVTPETWEGLHVLGPLCRSVYEAVNEQAEGGGTTYTLRLPADGMDVEPFIPAALPITLTIGLPNNTSDLREAILESLHEMVYDDGGPLRGITSWMVSSAIANAEGHISHELQLFNGETGAYTLTATAEQIHTLDDSDVTFVTL